MGGDRRSAGRMTPLSPQDIHHRLHRLGQLSQVGAGCPTRIPNRFGTLTAPIGAILRSSGFRLEALLARGARLQHVTTPTVRPSQGSEQHEEAAWCPFAST